VGSRGDDSKKARYLALLGRSNKSIGIPRNGQAVN